MTNLPKSLFLDPVLNALQTSHSHLAITFGEAIRYPAAVTPFAAIARPTTSALRDLHTLLEPDDYVWVAAIGEAEPASAGLLQRATIEVHQMVLPPEVLLPAHDLEIVPLDCTRAEQMVALTDIAFPGFFRPRTCEMGSYFGIYEKSELIAMGGERLLFPGYSEISGICTHPEYRGRSYAARMLYHLAQFDRARCVIPWLHVTATNESAINLYFKLGFRIVRSINLNKLTVA